MVSGGPAEMPAEGAALPDEVMTKLQDTATILTQERKKRGRTIPEGLMSAENMSHFATLSSNPVSNHSVVLRQILIDIYNLKSYLSLTVYRNILKHNLYIAME